MGYLESLFERPRNETQLREVLRKDYLAILLSSIISGAFLFLMVMANDFTSVIKYGFLFLAALLLSALAYLDGVLYALKYTRGK